MAKTILDEKIARLEAELKNAKATKTKEVRKERNRQLIAFGLYVEEFFKNSDDEEKKKFEENIKKYLSGRNLEHALTGLTRIMMNTAHLE